MESSAAFPPTRWSLVVSSSEQDEAALEELCRLYWQPLYAFSRRTGLSIEDAEDITQLFFHDLVKDRAGVLASASPGSGRLRTLFLRILQRRINDHYRHATREKRGGGRLVSLDTGAAEAALQAASPDATPEQIFDRQWALSILQFALARLEKDFTAAGRAHHFAALTPFLGLGEDSGNHAQLQSVLQLNEAAARQTVHRFRERFRRHLRAEIAETIADTDDEAIVRELRQLQHALRPAGSV